ncbi:M14 family metallopeptidase [Caulobacter vibrioides]|nr:M14 family metallopeptidase [Caulobacter vibrioides]YP_002515688.1 peptidase, M14 family [Caulobacter vibrioides NA1000]ACL93780.1 peptidase, M14 family [Caulobacter vibrioides NA1000]ATC27142.1 carboxypeptidase [Caulobacter vibrioides]QXZ52404.1 M14 family metallopeptidase [Caulobacter vibrioides]
MRTTALLATALLALGAPVMAQTTPPKAPWDEAFLPPAPHWQGASQALIRDKADPWVTPFEADAEHNVSPTYADTRAWFQKLDKASPLIRVEDFGVSPQGREIFAVIASKDGDKLDPKKPLLLVQAGIHPGEIDGKDAGMMLLRDMAFHDKDSLLDKVNLVLIPILSVDGHERASAYSRPNQRGPRIQGWRNTATNQNLNRDFMKLDQPEMRALKRLQAKYKADLYVDVHVTDGMDYQYDVTYGFNGENGVWNRSPAIAKWLDGVLKPVMNKSLEAEGHIPGELVFGVDEHNPKAGFSDGGLGERFSSGWGAAAHVPTILIENHSLKPHAQRVLGTYVFIETALKLLAEKGGDLRQAIAADSALRPAEIPANFVADPKPAYTRAFKGIRYEYYDSPASGRKEVRWLGEVDPEIWNVPFYGSKPSLTLKRPAAYYVPSHRPDIIERLKLHGVALEALPADKTLKVEMIRLVEPKIAPRANEGHVQISVDKVTTETRDWTFPKGSVRVPTDQPLGDLVVLLLEPQSSESLFAWGMVPEVLSRVEYIEPYAIAPLAEKMMAADPALKAEFEAKLAAEPKFAADPAARLAWFYKRTPFYDDHHLLYPIAREIAR